VHTQRTPGAYTVASASSWSPVHSYLFTRMETVLWVSSFGVLDICYCCRVWHKCRNEMNISGQKLISCSDDYSLTYFQFVQMSLMTTTHVEFNEYIVYMEIKCVWAAVRDGLAESVRFQAGDWKITFRRGGGGFDRFVICAVFAAGYFRWRITTRAPVTRNSTPLYIHYISGAGRSACEGFLMLSDWDCCFSVVIKDLS